MGVSHLRATLGEADIRVLVKGGGDEERALAAHRLCRKFDSPTLSEEDRAAAADLVRFMARDATEMVRRALAVTLKNSRHLPQDVAKRLARDTDLVAIPVLENSPVLTDEDLASVLSACSPAGQMAVTRRPVLGRATTAALAVHGTPEAVEAGLRHRQASFAEATYRVLMDRFVATPSIHQAIVDRELLPTTVTEKLITLVSGALFETLVNRHALPPQLAVELATGSRERATVDLAAQAMLQPDPKRFVQQLHLNGRLTPSLVLRALCLGATAFVEHAFAELAGVAHSRAWLLVHDAGPLGFKAIYERAGMPQKLYTAFRTALDTQHETDFDGGPEDRARFSQRLIQRILTRQPGFPEEDAAYLLDRLDALERLEPALPLAMAG